MIERLFF
ncbi:hypothetical protein YPPY11_4684, partial [Yersinia pestis PY-11]